MTNRALADTSTSSFCTFRAERRLYGINVTSLQEISTNLDITPVPPAPVAVRGLANLRSRVFLILDLRPLLGLAPIASTPDSRIIVFKSDVSQDTGLLVDGGGDILVVPQDRIERIEGIETQEISSVSSQAPEEGREAGKDRRLVVATCKLETELLMIIDATRLEGVVAEQLRET